MIKAQEKKKNKPAGAPLAHGVGRRKSSVARAWVRRGKGALLVNGLSYEQYFDTQETRMQAYTPIKLSPHGHLYDIQINVEGGGKNAQADAIKLAVARAFVSQNEELKSLMRKHGLLTVDSRIKERKKPGQPGARRKFQFVKR